LAHPVIRLIDNVLLFCHVSIQHITQLHEVKQADGYVAVALGISAESSYNPWQGKINYK